MQGNQPITPASEQTPGLAELTFVTFTRGLSEESHFSCLVMVKKKLGSSFDQQSKNKESKEQMGSFVHKTAKSVLAFSVLRTALPPYIEDVHISVWSWDICGIVLEKRIVQK